MVYCLGNCLLHKSQGSPIISFPIKNTDNLRKGSILGKLQFFLISYNINTFKYHVFAPMGRFQLESFTFIFHRRPSCYICVSVL